MDKPQDKIKLLESICVKLRTGIYNTVKTAKSGHLGGTSSSVELMTALYFGGILNYDINDPKNPNRDRVLVRGHLGPLRYNIFTLLGWIYPEELATYRQLGSRLQGHEAMELAPGVDLTPSGSLGMILSYGTGCAVAAKEMKKTFKTYVFLGDGEEQEGNINEAARHAANLRLDNLICILDKNKKQLSRSTSNSDSAADVKQIWKGYGWNVKEIKDGHSIPEILDVYSNINLAKRPTFIIANTIKGKGLIGAEENCCGYHTISSCPKDLLEKSIKNTQEKFRGYNSDFWPKLAELFPQFKSVKVTSYKNNTNIKIDIEPDYTQDSIVDGFCEYAKILNKKLSDSKTRFYAITADLIREDQVENELGLIKPTKYLDVGIREQHMLGLAHGISFTDPNSRILVNSGDAFFYRAADQLNVMAQSGCKVVIAADDGGISGANNGPTHQSSGQPGALLTMPGVTFLEPADSVDLYNCFNWAFTKYPGPVYVRLYSANIKPLTERNRRIDHYVAIDSPNPDLVIVASGLPTAYAVKAATSLKQEYNISCKVINVINMKSLDERFVNELEVGKPVLTVYNGNPYILKSAVASAVMGYDLKKPSLIIGHGFEIGTSGKLEDLIQHFKFDKEGIINVAKEKFPETFKIK